MKNLGGVFIISGLITVLQSDLAGAAQKLGYGSRAGMEVTILSKEGINTEQAVILTKHTREDAMKFCAQYVGKITQSCINEELNSDLNDRVTANCKTGEFFDFYGEKYRFEGKSTDRTSDNSMAKYMLRNLSTDELADGSSASGYPVNMEIFRALCPKIAPKDE